LIRPPRLVAAGKDLRSCGNRLAVGVDLLHTRRLVRRWLLLAHIPLPCRSKPWREFSPNGLLRRGSLSDCAHLSLYLKPIQARHSWT
jgi:hypothetical protein